MKGKEIDLRKRNQFNLLTYLNGCFIWEGEKELAKAASLNYDFGTNQFWTISVPTARLLIDYADSRALAELTKDEQP